MVCDLRVCVRRVTLSGAVMLGIGYASAGNQVGTQREPVPASSSIARGQNRCPTIVGSDTRERYNDIFSKVCRARQDDNPVRSVARPSDSRVVTN